jgi:DNA repair protein RadC
MTFNCSPKALPETERPRERLARLGPDVLSHVELIAVLLGSGTKGKSVFALSYELLSHFGSLSSLLDASIADLCQVKGLGQAKAVQLKAALSLALRVYREKAMPTETLNTPLKAYLWVRDLISFEKREVFGAILLDAKGAPLRWEIISVGTLTQALVHPREVFYPAIRYLAASLILVHNHPSGDPTPSGQDRHLTRQLITVSRSVSIPIMDHLIIGKRHFISLKEAGFYFPSCVTTKVVASPTRKG